MNADAEGEGIKGDCDSTVLGGFPVPFSDILEQFFVIFVLVLPFGQFEVFDEGNGVEVHENGHKGELDDTPDAEQGTARRQLGPTHSKADHLAIAEATCPIKLQ